MSASSSDSPACAESLVGRAQHRRKAFLDAEADVGRTGGALAADVALKVDKAGTAPRSAAIYTKK